MTHELQTMNRTELTLMLKEFLTVSNKRKEESCQTPDIQNLLYSEARALREKYYENSVFVRGLIEFTSHCKMDCYYCGLRRSNTKAIRYRLTKEQILECCKNGHDMGFRSFVLQGGEDSFWDDKKLCELINDIKESCADCAVTLSVGERSTQSYKVLRAAGADRYLLRHESASAEHYGMLHPPAQTLENRKRCLFALKEIGFQVGAGFMVGTPGQRAEHLAEDLVFLRELQPEMVGIGPFIAHAETHFSKEETGCVEDVLLMIALVRIMLPEVLLPATTALGSISSEGRNLGLMAGANVVMPNLSPAWIRGAYNIYDNKVSTGIEAIEGITQLCEEVEKVGMKADFGRGDHVWHIS